MEELKKERETLRKEQIKSYKEQENKDKESIISNLKKSMQNELVKACLFGVSVQL